MNLEIFRQTEKKNRIAKLPLNHARIFTEIDCYIWIKPTERIIYTKYIYMQYTKEEHTSTPIYTCSLFILFRKLSTGDRDKKKTYLTMLIDIISLKENKNLFY